LLPRGKVGLVVHDFTHSIVPNGKLSPCLLTITSSEGGLGFVSLVDQDVISVCRELEIISNLAIIEGQAFRSRIQAIRNYKQENLEDIVNHARKNIYKLAGYGIYFQDKEDDIINNILASFNKEHRFASLGTQAHKGGTRYSIGSGKTINQHLAFGDKVYAILKKLQSNKWLFNDEIETEIKSSCISKKNLANRILKIRKDRFLNIASIFSFWEWINDNECSQRSVSSDAKDWNFVDIPKLIQVKFPQSYINFDDTRIKKEAAILMEIKAWDMPLMETESHYDISNKFQFIFEKIINSDSPLLVSTDGAHNIFHTKSDTVTPSTETTSAFVLSTCDVRDKESPTTKEWKDRPTIPLLCRATKLPQNIGSTPSDIATGELFAIAMSELSLHQQIPRIIITDSKSTRDLLLELRKKNVMDEMDRHYIRNISGGVSKFIFHLFQKKFLNISDENSNDIPSLLRLKLQSSQRRMCETALTWTRPDSTVSNNLQEKDSHRVWEAEYWDDNQLRTIWKVNSHQLDEEGTRIKSAPRYGNLVPNLCLLSANHHADVGADLVKKFKQSTRNIKIAASLLRFSLIWDGKTIDRNISEVIRKAIMQERLKRLKRKPTQGFLHRIIEHTTSDWKTFQNNKGLFRSLTGLSRTHSRSLYKNEDYRDTCREVRIQQAKNPMEKEKLENLTSKQDIITALSPCMWCSHAPHETITAKGNRKHAFLHCSNEEISTFRADMLQLINSKLRSFIISLIQASTWEFAINLIRNIAAEFLFHQENNTGRLRDIPGTRNNLYLTIEDILMKYGKESIKSAILDSNCTMLLDVFGMIPRENFSNFGDEELGIIDLPWLGLIPNFLDNMIIQACVTLDGNHPYLPTKEAMTKDIICTWNIIKNINLARATGLHRIIGTTGKSTRKEFIKTTQVRQEDLTDITPSPAATSPTISISPDQQQTNRKRPLVSTYSDLNSTTKAKKLKLTSISNKQKLPITTAEREDQPVLESKTCNGVTCGKEAGFWCMECSYEPILIRQSIKQCQRCSRFMTALKQAHDLISKIQANPSMYSETNLNSILQFCKDNPDNLQFRYTQIMDLLDTSISKEKKIQQARYTKKSLPDRQKIICKIIHKSLLHHAKREDSTTTIFDQSASFLQQTFNKLNQKLLSIKSANKINVKTDPFLRNKSLIQKYSTSNKSSLSSSQAIATNCANTYLSGQAIKHAVEVIRDRHTPNVYIAHSDAYLTIESWEINLGWSNFARIFSSQRVLDQKPMGIYMIPMFTGSNNSGHWNTIVIEKRRNCCQGWVIDSLGSSELNRQLKEKIHRAFLPGRGRFIWTTHTSRNQTECECGPRTILALHLSASIIADGGTTERAVEEASLLHIETTEYKADLVRLEAALLVDEHRPSMVSRLRRSIVRIAEPGDSVRSKKRRKRGSKEKRTRQETVTIED